jgi:hypothetical protein
VISGKSVSLPYTSLNTSFQDKCKLPSPSPPSGDEGFRFLKVSKTLFGLTTVVTLIHLLLIQ